MTRTHDVVRARSKSALSCSFFNPRSFSHQATEKPSCAAGRALPPSRDRSQGHLVSSRTSKPERRPQQSAGIIQATPSKHIHSTSRSHSPPNVGGKTDIPTKPFHQARSNRKTSRILENKQPQTTPTTKCKHHPSKPIQANQLDIPLSLPTRRRGPAFRLKQHPSSKKQSQVISHPQEQASPNNAHNKVQASSKQARPSTSTRLPALAPHPTLGDNKPTFRPSPSIKQEAITRPSRILQNKRAQTTPTTECKHHPSKPIQAHQLDIPHSLPTRRKGSVIRPNPSNNHEAIASHLVLSRASKPGRRPQQGASSIKARPPEYFNSTSRSYFPIDGRTWSNDDVNIPRTYGHDGHIALETPTPPHRGTPAPRPCGLVAPLYSTFWTFFGLAGLHMKFPKRHTLEKSMMLLILCPGHDWIVLGTSKWV